MNAETRRNAMNAPTMHVEWLPNEAYWQGGCWCVMLGNNHLFLEAAQKGRHALTESRLRRLVALWNSAPLAKAA